MHQHQCKHCRNSFVCGEDASECFQTAITCNSCWWSVELRQVLIYFGLVIVVLVMMVALFGKGEQDLKKAFVECYRQKPFVLYAPARLDPVK